MRIERMPLVTMCVVVMRDGIVPGPRSGGGPARRAKKRQKDQPPRIEGGEPGGRRRQQITVEGAGAIRRKGGLDDRILGIIAGGVGKAR